MLVHEGSTAALRFSGDNQVVQYGLRPLSRTDPFSLSLRLKPTVRQDRAILVHQSRAWSDAGSRGFELTLDRGRPFFGLIHFWPGNAIAVRAKRALPLNQWSRLVVDLRRIEPRGRHPPLSRRPAARDRRGPRSFVQGHRLRPGDRGSADGGSSAHHRRPLPRQRVQGRVDRRSAGVRFVPDGGRGRLVGSTRFARPRRIRALPRPAPSAVHLGECRPQAPSRGGEHARLARAGDHGHGGNASAAAGASAQARRV